MKFLAEIIYRCAKSHSTVFMLFIFLLSQPLVSFAQNTTNPLPHDLSPWGMFMSADWVVKAVMVGLMLASMLTWTVLIAKTIELRSQRLQLAKNLAALIEAKSLKNLNRDDIAKGVGLSLLQVAESELVLADEFSRNTAGYAKIHSGIKERAVSHLSRIEMGFGRNLLKGTGLLATTGSVAPFVGLFGTVWGIMNSFIGISQANTTNLAVVAPGIAEALLATAMGLAAAIPAVVIYNYFMRLITEIKAQAADCSAALMRLVSRDLDSESSSVG